ncbi:hypothetical protein [Moorena producens]|uniref:hypothetical protein n=1 Tax=Moorena producens TaxID=1155739 RepID=UPI0013149174|nr:hypothetical protein [Moorena producens]
MQSLMGETTAVAHGLFAKRGLRPSYRKTVEPCLDAVAHGGNPQDRANHANQ